MPTSAEAIKLPSETFSILTDLASPAEWASRANVACGRMPALRELFDMIDARKVKSPHGHEVTLGEYAVTRAQAELFYYLITQIKPILSLETGYDVGLLAGVMTAAHMQNGLNGGHIPVQDHANKANEGIGAYTMERLALTGYQIMEHEPALVLPQIYLQQLNNGLKLVYFNSADSVDEQMMEYFYINKLLNDGGIMAINTLSPARQELIAFIRKTRHDYAIKELPCNITLIQKPYLSDIKGLTTSGFKH